MKIGKIRISKKWLFVIIIIVIILGYYAVRQVLKNPADGYLTEKIERGEVLQEISETGSVKATEELSLGFKAVGKIARINTIVGENVKRGDILAELDSGQISAQVLSAKAALQSAESEYEKLINGSTSEYIKIYQDAVDSAQQTLDSEYEDAINNLDSVYSKIYDAYNTVILMQYNYFSSADQQGIKIQDSKNDIAGNMEDIKIYIDKTKESKETKDVDNTISRAILVLDNVYNDLKVAREQCDQGSYYLNISSTDKALLDTQKTYINTSLSTIKALQQNISAYKINLQKAKNDLAYRTAGPRQEDIDIYSLAVEKARANLELYQSQIGDNYIYSPIDGKITAINAKKGETVNTSSIIDLLSSEPFQIKVDIYEQDIVNVKTGDLVKIELVAFPKDTFEGKVLSIDPAEKIVDNVVYYQVTIDFPEQPDGIRSGMTADIVIQTNKKEDVLRISKNAVESIGGKELVQVFINKKIEEREIITGLEGTDYFEVLSGLSEGDEIILNQN
jgi:HlyD family secretion protein